MSYAIVFNSRTGNTALLAQTIREALSPEDCLYFGPPDPQALTALPICGVGGLTDPDFVEEQLRKGRVDCVAMSRQLIADPDWPRKAAEGRTGEIRRCVRCNKACLGGMMAHRGVHCIYEKEEIL